MNKYVKTFAFELQQLPASRQGPLRYIKGVVAESIDFFGSQNTHFIKIILFQMWERLAKLGEKTGSCVVGD